MLPGTEDPRLPSVGVAKQVEGNDSQHLNCQGSQSSRWNYVQSLSSYSLRNRTRFSANKVVGRTPLMQAAMAGLVSDVEELLASSRIDLQDDMGMTALMWAACSAVYPPSNSQNFAAVVKLLLDAKASVNMEDDNGVTAIMHTFSNGLDIINNPLQEHEVEESKLQTFKLLLEGSRGLKISQKCARRDCNSVS